MPITTNARLLKSLASEEYEINSGRVGGLICPVCDAWIYGDQWNGECEHLLRESIAGADGFQRPCVEIETATDGDVSCIFLPKRARKKKDAFLRNDEWVPVQTVTCDVGGCGITAWFAIPVDMLGGSRGPRAAMRRLIADVQRTFDDAAEEEDEDEQD